MIRPITEAELFALRSDIQHPYYMGPFFDIRKHRTCIIGHILWKRGEKAEPQDINEYRDYLMQYGDVRRLRLFNLEKHPDPTNITAAEQTLFEDVAISFTVKDAVQAITNYFDPTVESWDIWPWADRGYPENKNWLTTLEAA